MFSLKKKGSSSTKTISPKKEIEMTENANPTTTVKSNTGTLSIVQTLVSYAHNQLAAGISDKEIIATIMARGASKEVAEIIISKAKEIAI